MSATDAVVVDGARGEVVTLERVTGQGRAVTLSVEEGPVARRRRGRVGGLVGLALGVAMLATFYAVGRAQRTPADGWDFSLCPFLAAFFVVPVVVWLGVVVARRRRPAPRIIHVGDGVLDGSDDLGPLQSVERQGATLVLCCERGVLELELGSELDARLLHGRINEDARPITASEG